MFDMSVTLTGIYFVGSEPSDFPSSLDLIASIALLYASNTPCFSRLPNDYTEAIDIIAEFIDNSTQAEDVKKLTCSLSPPGVCSLINSSKR